MTYKKKSILFWVFSFVLMVASAYYQRTTGPTYPRSGEVEINGETIKYKLVRTWDTGTGAEATIKVINTAITGKFRYKRYKSFDEWTEKPMIRKGEELVATMPGLPAAGKMMYEIYLNDGGKFVKLEEGPLVLRYKGAVPAFILIPHIILIFLGMMFSMRALFEAMTKGKNLVNYSFWTVILLAIGGMIFGPIVQKYAFDAYWTGWPFGTDLTDNKMLIAFVLWVVAYFMVRKNPKRRGWVIAAAVVLLMIYLIPHSMFGSEIDYTKQ